MTDKPLSETHRTLISKLPSDGGPVIFTSLGNVLIDIEHLQLCTVDIAEHERIVAESKNESYTKGLEQGECNFKEEVEHLKKELEQYSNMIPHNIVYNNGVAEGERRAMQRVKEVLNEETAYCEVSHMDSCDCYLVVNAIKKKVGVSDKGGELTASERESVQRGLNDVAKGGVVTTQEPKARLFNKDDEVQP